ncbi:GAF domain-containing protein [Candidatus Sumerlaeota bacterium]|nr:GAF domain-containing protein [Candidatus Sumerlaeota bacterium]
MHPKKTASPTDHPYFQALPSLFRICTAMGSTLELRSLLKLILRLTMEQLRAHRGSILLYDQASDQLRMLAARGMPREIVKRGYIPRKGSIAEWVIENDKPLLLDEIRENSPFTSIARAMRIHSAMCVPLRAKGKIIGTINISRTRRERFTEQDLDVLVVLATHAAMSIENARLYEENLRAERLAAVGRTVASISHDMRNMLMGLKGGAKLVEMGLKDKSWEIALQGWEIARRASSRIELLMLDMLDYSKERVPSRTNVQLPRLVNEVFNTLSYLAEQEAVRLVSQLDPACASVYADSNQLYRALLNLVTNAIEAIRDKRSGGGEVAIVTERVNDDSPLVPRHLRKAEGQFDLIRVRDNGPGIPPELLPNIFQPFFSSKGSKGTGLGLAVTRKIAREHAGDLLVETEVGQWTIFTLALPVVQPPSADRAPM